MQQDIASIAPVATEPRGFRLPAAVAVLALIGPAVVFLSVFYLLPLVKLVALSVELPTFTLEYYLTFFREDIYLRVLLKTLTIAVFTTLICFLLGYPVAYFLSHATPTVQRLCLILIVIPYLTSFLVRAYALIVILSNRGIINGFLLWSGITDEPVKLVYNTIGVYVGMVHIMLPFMVLPLFAAMSNIDRRLVLAAQSLGAGPTATFLRVYLPLSAPGVVSGSILVFVLSLGFYIMPALMGGLSDLMLVNLIDVHARELANWEFAAAASVILLLFTLLSFVLVGRLFGDRGLVGLLTGDARHGRYRGPRLSLGSLLRGLVGALIRRIASACAATARAAGLRVSRATRRDTPIVHPVRWSYLALVGTVLFGLILPSLVVIPMSFSSAQFITFPPPGWSTQWYEEFFRREDWINALLLSLQVAVGTSLLATLFGTLASYAVVKWRFYGRTALVFLIISPIIVPPIIVGIGLYGYYVDWRLLGSVPGIMFAHCIGGTALAFVAVTANLARFDFGLEQAAMSLGAGPFRTFCSVTLPLIRPGMIAGALFAFIYSFDELVVTMLIAGVRRETLPLKIWNNIRNEIDPVIAAVSVLLILLPLFWLALLVLNQRRAIRTARTET